MGKKGGMCEYGCFDFLLVTLYLLMFCLCLLFNALLQCHLRKLLLIAKANGMPHL